MRYESWANGEIKLITNLYCPFSILLGSLSYEMLYFYLHCNSKYYQKHAKYL